ncbi:MAG: hypothetical protein L0H23_11590, partial [Luteimonas sp.]|nr:hypothetical protein [Luteimonas sp.]
FGGDPAAAKNSRLKPLPQEFATSICPAEVRCLSWAESWPAKQCGTTKPLAFDWCLIRNNAHSTVPSDDPAAAPFSNVDGSFRLRQTAQFSKFETNQLLVDKA